jgi:hypothetical protein
MGMVTTGTGTHQSAVESVATIDLSFSFCHKNNWHNSFIAAQLKAQIMVSGLFCVELLTEAQ